MRASSWLIRTNGTVDRVAWYVFWYRDQTHYTGINLYKNGVGLKLLMPHRVVGEK